MLIGNENINFWSWSSRQGSDGMLIGNDYELPPMSFVPIKFPQGSSVPNILPLAKQSISLEFGVRVQKNVDNYVEN